MMPDLLDLDPVQTYDLTNYAEVIVEALTAYRHEAVICARAFADMGEHNAAIDCNRKATELTTVLSCFGV